MNYITYIVKFLFRIKWWLIICPIIVAIMLFYKIGAAPSRYKAQTTIYTGIVSGYDIETSSGQRQDWNVINNAMDNLINIIQSQTTLKKVSMRLYAQALVHADPNQDNNYITARSSRILLQKTPSHVMALVDKTSEEKTLENLENYETADQKNHVYGIFQYKHPHYSYEALRKIKVKRMNNSDMIELEYENNDASIVYNTLQLLNDEFVKQYRTLRFGETNNVIAYFEGELARVGSDLREMEDSLRDYNVENQVINYDEQTKHIAALSRDYELRYEEILLNYEGSESLRTTLEQQIDGLQTFRNNTEFINKLHSISNLYSRISAAEAFSTDGSMSLSENKIRLGKDNLDSKSEKKKAEKGIKEPRMAIVTKLSPDQALLPNAEEVRAAALASKNENLPTLRDQLNAETQRLQTVMSEISNQQFTKEGISSSKMVSQWLDALLLSHKSFAEIEVMKLRKASLDQKYVIFSPIGSTLKRKNRAIGFSENSYLSILSALNTARLRQKNLQMSSATLKIINPPILPISAESNKRMILCLGAAMVTFIFVLAFFILLEIIDRTLRDRMRTERITGGKVISAFPGTGRLGERRFTETYRQIAAKHLGNTTLNYLKAGSPNIINFVSTEPGDGKSTVMESLANHFRETGMKIRVISWNKDFSIDRKEYLLAERLSDFVIDKANEVNISDADIILIEYPSFTSSSIPRALLQQAALNLLVLPANRTWKDTDEELYKTAKELIGQTPMDICLNYSQRDVVESFTGLMPPYSRWRRLMYQISQFGFTAIK